MELIKNIFFNTDKLIENSEVKISYTGRFFQDGSESVTVHYGFGNNWDKLTDIEMKKTELGFQAEIKLENAAELNLCFKNNKNEWDNNEGKNYSFQVEKAPKELAVVKQQIVYPKKLRKTYLWAKKIKLAMYKIIKYFPRIISGNLKEKNEVKEDNQ